MPFLTKDSNAHTTAVYRQLLAARDAHLAAEAAEAAAEAAAAEAEAAAAAEEAEAAVTAAAPGCQICFEAYGSIRPSLKFEPPS